MSVKVLGIILVLVFTTQSSRVMAAQNTGWCQDDITAGWSFYCDPEPEEVEEVEETPLPAPPPALPKPTATEEIMQYRAELDELKYRAVLNPSEENVQEYMFAQQAMVGKAKEFTDQWQRIIFKTPALDANIKYPISSIGTNIYQDQTRQAQEDAFVRAAQNNGLLFVFEGPETCGVCVPAVGIIANMRDEFGIEVLAVTADGITYPQFPDAVRDAGQLATLRLTDFPKPILALVDPGSGALDIIGSGLITKDQILERVRIITEIPVGERY
ncbi:hypothetical protein A9Q96_10030 [Rhodobacterales bacterium 52_120_T64]|nr:hypothetical protein A9Q96_10030 [Rhodobacterales bacterium 52_120_T64]